MSQPVLRPSVVPIPRGGGATWRLEVHDRLGSTSDLCKARLEAGAGADGIAILALEQTAGRGSRGRAWSDPGGNLALSVMLVGQGAAVPVGLWPFIAGLALHDAVAGYVPAGHVLELKWPNDLLLDGGKMAGILIETGIGAGVSWQVIGIGANLRGKPDIAGRTLACLADCGVDAPAAPAVARKLLHHLGLWLSCYETHGFAAIRTAWLDRGHAIGTPIRVRAGNQQFTGTFAGLGDDGILLLRTPGGVRRVVTGEVLLAPATPE
ncbi:biotin--[acetyl-CoA-carboxylase] ligase [Komagataeibacter swingsii]|uniref:biotin--[biotin carboxyl-carrier protein] ligase n=1 Tax=Komagataeibacter swingsii TaxID=215220 RepID=A0A2V4RN89_9PROT|nr:biotin--[acetyl-CoA-carboxylase] ligase [Komagataeibacter swingsii]PYD71392.1 biotin--[acetyl-CoA-carboxylase] ligase [Komagataeibacter swingsii]GBQ63147.1 biotin--acetyl-CoA-carboxylase ligase [Komagataeibacter swingsii DSM 16373]